MKTPKIKAKDFELGAYFGALSASRTSAPIRSTACARAYHVTEDIFLEGFLARSKAGTEQPRGRISRTSRCSATLGGSFTYYDLDVGYNVLPGEVFLGRGRAFNSALYVTVGMGDVKFADTGPVRAEFRRGHSHPDHRLAGDASGRPRPRVRVRPVRRRQERRTTSKRTLGLTTFF